MAVPDTLIGRTISRYRIVEKIGAGGMGVVYRARDEDLDRDVALKFLPIGVLSDEAARKRFRKEALVLAKMNHPNVATIHEFLTENDRDFLVMEYVAGISLSQEIAANGPIPEKRLVAVAAQVAQALQEAHERGVVHRDLKPGNIMINSKGLAKVLDFGLADHLFLVGEQTTASLNDSRVLAGTLPYMAPEQLLSKATDARADIYGLGAVLYEMSTGHPPFRDVVPARLFDAILHEVPASPHNPNNSIQPSLKQIILKCLEKEPEDRYQSAKEVEVDLRRLSRPKESASARDRLKDTVRWRRTIAAMQFVYAVPFVCNWFEGARLMGRALPSGAGWTALIVTWVLSLGLVAIYLATAWGIGRSEKRVLQSFLRWFPLHLFLDWLGLAAFIGMAVKFNFFVLYLLLLLVLGCLPFYQRHLAKELWAKIQ
jgi:serine/threonine protein kinase